MRRREVLGAVGGATVWPLMARAQQAVPAVGFLHSTSRAANERLIAACNAGLREVGFAEAQNVRVEYRWAEGDYGRLSDMAADLVARSVSVIVTAGGVPPALAAKAATRIVPVVFVSGSDPIEFGLVSSLNRPEGNITGVHLLAYLLDSKRVELLRELLPGAASIALLANPSSPQAQAQIDNVERAVRTLGARLVVLNATIPSEVESAFARIVMEKVDALLVSADPFLLNQREQIVDLAARHALPAAYQWREFAELGGLMSYGTSIADAYRHAGVYAGRILKGQRVAELPVQQAVKVELVVNLKTARRLSIQVPQSILARADEVIE
jgi:putative tryptophan/tyrosine transport system substrate-binding protein